MPIWVIPGGTGEMGETPLQTALREFHEETGALISSKRVTLVAEYSPKSKKGKYKYLFTTTRSVLANLQCTEETVDYGYFDIQDLPFHLTEYEKRKIIEAFLRSTTNILRRQDTVSFLLEISSLLSNPAHLLRLVFLYMRTKWKSR